jgi:hypothetical protein
MPNIKIVREARGKNLCKRCTHCTHIVTAKEEIVRCHILKRPISGVEFCNQFLDASLPSLDDMCRIATHIVRDKAGRIGFKTNDQLRNEGKDTINLWDT